MNIKGEVQNHILWFIVLLIIVVLGLILFYLGGFKIIKGLLEKIVFD